MKLSTRAVAIFLLAIGTLPAAADTDPWAGLYQAIDPNDGSTNYMSIVPVENEEYVLHVSVSDHAKCGSPAVIVASASVQQDKLLRENAQLQCQGSESMEHSDATYELDRNNGIITLTAPFDGRVLYYHRLSD